LGGRLHDLKTILRQCVALLTVALIFSAYALADGGSDFKFKCAPCHGARGAGDTKLGQNLHVRDLGSADVQKQSNDELAAIIVKGKGKMPRNEGKLTKEQINELVKFIRTLKK
jgi:mono/diheme cytochrome c family protein